MKNLIYFIIIFLFLVSGGFMFAKSPEKEFPLTQKQIEFEQEQKNDDSYTKAQWSNSFTFDLTYDITKFDYLTKPEASKHALLFGAYGYSYTQQDICVRIFLSTKKDPLAYECVGKDIPTES